MEKFEKYCMPKKNLFYERHRFNTRIQNKEDNFDTFLTDIRNIVINCEYGTLEDDLLKDRIIAGIYSEELKSKLLKLNYDNVTLNKVIEECRAFESSKSNLLKMKNEEYQVQKLFKKKNKVFEKYSQQTRPKYKNEMKNRPTMECKFCAGQHPMNKKLCPVYGKVCSICKK